MVRACLLTMRSVGHSNLVKWAHRRPEPSSLGILEMAKSREIGPKLADEPRRLLRSHPLIRILPASTAPTRSQGLGCAHLPCSVAISPP